MEFEVDIGFANAPHLREARSRSRETLRSVRGLLESICIDDLRIATIAVAGSLARLEQTANSDIDLIVVVHSETDVSTELVDAVNRRLATLGMSTTKPGGIFSRPFTASQLCDPSTLGVVDEDMAVFGARMHLLLEARPVFGDDAFFALTQGVLSRFADRTSERMCLWSSLLDDLVRYHRSLSARYRQIERFEPARAKSLRLKAGYSRFTNVAGLMLLLGKSLIATIDPVDWMKLQLNLTPLERIGLVFSRHGGKSFPLLLASYDRFIAALDDRLPEEEQQTLDASADSMRSIVVEFLLDADERGEWPRLFLQQLLF